MSARGPAYRRPHPRIIGSGGAAGCGRPAGRRSGRAGRRRAAGRGSRLRAAGLRAAGLRAVRLRTVGLGAVRLRAVRLRTVGLGAVLGRTVGRLLAAVGAVEARALEHDADGVEDLAEPAGALRALGQGVVGEGLHGLEAVAALGAGVLVRRQRTTSRSGTPTCRVLIMRHAAPRRNKVPPAQVGVTPSGSMCASTRWPEVIGSGGSTEPVMTTWPAASTSPHAPSSSAAWRTSSTTSPPVRAAGSSVE